MNHKCVVHAAIIAAIVTLQGVALADKPAGAPHGPPGAKPPAPASSLGKHEHGPENGHVEAGANPRGPHESDDAGKGNPHEGRGPDNEHVGEKPDSNRPESMQDLRERVRSGKISKEDLKEKLQKLHGTEAERGREHKQELAHRWGPAISRPPVTEELRHHARRMAFLNRAMVLAATENVQNKDKVTERISKLIDLENQRHDKAMQRLKTEAQQGDHAASASASAGPAASASPVGKEEAK